MSGKASLSSNLEELPTETKLLSEPPSRN